MKITDVMREGGLWERAWEPARNALSRQADPLMKQGLYSPWTIRLGKGGEGYEGPEISLYRHVMDILRVSTELLYLRWQAGRLQGVGPEDGEGFRKVLTSLMAVALAHDANKYVGTGSHRPTEEEVRKAAEDLRMAEWVPGDLWGGFTVGKLHTAVLLGENRGLGLALGSEPIPKIVEDVATAVHEADNLASRTHTPEEFVEEYNKLVVPWRHRYGVEAQPRRLLKWRDEPPVLHLLQTAILDLLYQAESVPLVLWRNGSMLYAAVPESVTPREILDRLRDLLSERKPMLRYIPTSGDVVIDAVGSLDDLREALRAAGWPQGLLSVKRADWEAVPALQDYARWWAAEKARGLVDAATEAPPDGQQFALVRRGRAHRDGDQPEVYERALMCSALLAEPEALKKALDWRGGLVKKELAEMGIEVGSLHPLTQRTVLAMQTAAHLADDEELEAWAEKVRGPFEEAPGGEPEGVPDLIAQLEAQVGATKPKNEPAPYSAARGGGTCLLCGAPATRKIETNSSMLLLGVKTSAFNNRIGHKQDLSASTGENYICPACIARQRVWVEYGPEPVRRNSSRASAPMLVATPLVSWLHGTREARESERELFAKTVDENASRWLPWEAAVRDSRMLAWEEQPESLRETVSLMRQLAIYAALSGEPVHAFVHGQYDHQDAFYYEPVPERLLRHLEKAGLLTSRKGVRRQDLPGLIRLLKALEQLLAEESTGDEAFQFMDEFGWWAAAWCLMPRVYEGARERESLWNHLVTLREAYPMVTDEQMRSLAAKAAAIQNIPPKPSHNERVLVIRQVLDGLAGWAEMGDDDVMVQALAADLYVTLERREALRVAKGQKKDREYLDGVQAALREIVREILHIARGVHGDEGQPWELTSQETSFLLAAYEGYLWEARRQAAESGAAESDGETEQEEGEDEE